MMTKKYWISCFIIVCTALISFADDLKFSQSLMHCTSYSESGSISTEGMEVISHKQILGWENNKCVYKEILQMQGTSTCIVCKFNKSQLSELTSVMNAYNVVQQYSDTKIDTSTLSAVKDNPVVKAWSKYLQDTSVCTIN